MFGTFSNKQTSKSKMMFPLNEPSQTVFRHAAIGTHIKVSMLEPCQSVDALILVKWFDV